MECFIRGLLLRSFHPFEEHNAQSIHHLIVLWFALVHDGGHQLADRAPDEVAECALQHFRAGYWLRHVGPDVLRRAFLGIGQHGLDEHRYQVSNLAKGTCLRSQVQAVPFNLVAKLNIKLMVLKVPNPTNARHLSQQSEIASIASEGIASTLSQNGHSE
jgi:hypothetical protein